MRVASLGGLTTTQARLVVVNVGTELTTTLALASAIERADMPVLLVNCDPTPASTAHFEHLMTSWDFDVVDAPLLRHGDALDRLFRGINAELVLLLDSDAELRDAEFVARLRASFENPHVFGAGFINGPKWLTDRLGAAPMTGLFNERPWMPCVMLRTAHVLAALGAGASFRAHVVYNDVAWSARLSKLLGIRFQTGRVPRSRLLRRLLTSVRSRLRRARLPWLAWARRDFFGLRPNYVWCDTGTDIYHWCKYQQELVYAGLHVSLLEDEVAHYQGVTRAVMRPHQRTPAAAIGSIRDEVADRLATAYGIDWNALAPELHRT